MIRDLSRLWLIILKLSLKTSIGFCIISLLLMKELKLLLRSFIYIIGLLKSSAFWGMILSWKSVRGRIGPELSPFGKIMSKLESSGSFRSTLRSILTCVAITPWAPSSVWSTVGTSSPSMRIFLVIQIFGELYASFWKHWKSRFWTAGKAQLTCGLAHKALWTHKMHRRPFLLLQYLPYYPEYIQNTEDQNQ